MIDTSLVQLPDTQFWHAQFQPDTLANQLGWETSSRFPPLEIYKSPSLVHFTCSLSIISSEHPHGTNHHHCTNTRHCIHVEVIKDLHREVLLPQKSSFNHQIYILLQDQTLLILFNHYKTKHY